MIFLFSSVISLLKCLYNIDFILVRLSCSLFCLKFAKHIDHHIELEQRMHSIDSLTIKTI